MRTIDTLIGVVGKSFGVDLIGYLPARKYYHGKREEDARIPVVEHECERGEHHCEVPIIYSAIAATAVAEKYRMERAVEKYTDHIANAERE